MDHLTHNIIGINTLILLTHNIIKPQMTLKRRVSNSLKPYRHPTLSAKIILKKTLKKKYKQLLQKYAENMKKVESMNTG